MVRPCKLIESKMQVTEKISSNKQAYVDECSDK